MTIDYDGRRFRSASSSDNGQVGDGTIFEYHQLGDVVTAEYRGGEIREGHLIALVDGNSCLDMRYHHVNAAGEIMTGMCRSIPELMADGRLRLHEEWQWTCGDQSRGTSIMEEI